MATDGERVEQRLVLGELNAMVEVTMEVDKHVAAIQEWYNEAKAEMAHTDIDPQEIWFDVVSSYIGAELTGGEQHPMARKIRARLEVV